MYSNRVSIFAVLTIAVLGLATAPAARADDTRTLTANADEAAAPTSPTSDAPAIADDDQPVKKPVWLFWLVTGLGLASLAEGGAFFIDDAVLVQPALESAQSAYENPDVVCPGSSVASKQCFANEIHNMQTAAVADLSVGSFFAVVGVSLIAGALLFLYPYGE